MSKVKEEILSFDLRIYFYIICTLKFTFGEDRFKLDFVTSFSRESPTLFNTVL